LPPPNSYFFADTTNGEQLVFTATERHFDSAQRSPVSIVTRLSRDKHNISAGDLKAKVVFEKNTGPARLNLKRFDGARWQVLGNWEFGGTACAGGDDLALACVTDTFGSLVSSGATPVDADGAVVPVDQPNQLVQLRLNFANLPSPTGRCSLMTVKTGKDIASGSVNCKPSSRRNQLRTLTGAAEVERAIKDGLIAQLGRSYYYGPVIAVSEPQFSEATADSDGAAGGGSGGATSFTTTNLQERGVDEHDYVKTDGDFVYIVRSGWNSEGNPFIADAALPRPNSGAYTNLRVVDINPSNASASALTEIPLDFAAGSYDTGMFLYDAGNRLAITANSDSFSIWGSWYDSYSWTDSTSQVGLVDISNPAAPGIADQMSMDGRIISSRRVGNMLYVASRFTPSIRGIDYYVEEGSAEYNNSVAKIEAATLDELLPQVSINDGRSESLSQPEDCFVARRGNIEASADVITVAAINLDTATIADSVCYVGPSETMYMSPRSLYLATTRYDYETNNGGDEFFYADPDITTEIHKFALNAGSIDYRASGSVAGHMGWDPEKKPWRMSESGNQLRVVTMTDRFSFWPGGSDTDNSPVTLTVLDDTNSGRLDTLATLPNSLRTENLGKPGERLYASRFVGDRAYFVTFRATDPLYVIDLSNPADPRVAGELEIEGYSDYLHPVSDRLLLGLGKDAIPDEDGEFRGAWEQGVKLSLFDVSNPADPREVDTIIVGKRGTSTSALRTHKAFTYMPAANGNLARLALAIDLNETPNEYISGHPSDWYSWTSSGAWLFEVDQGSTPGIREVGRMLTRFPDGSSYYGSDGDWNERTIIADDAVYYVSDFEVFGASWNSPGAFNGPH